MGIRESLDHVFDIAEQMPRCWREASPAEQLRALRLQREISQRLLAETAGVGQAVVSRLESGADARWSTWKRLFAALGYEVTFAPLRVDEEDAVDYLQHEVWERSERMAKGRDARW